MSHAGKCGSVGVSVWGGSVCSHAHAQEYTFDIALAAKSNLHFCPRWSLVIEHLQTFARETVCVYVCTMHCIYTCLYMYMYVHKYMYTYKYMQVYSYMYMYSYMQAYSYMYMYSYMQVYSYMYMYSYMQVYSYMYMYSYVPRPGALRVHHAWRRICQWSCCQSSAKDLPPKGAVWHLPPGLPFWRQEREGGREEESEKRVGRKWREKGKREKEGGRE